MGRFPSLFSGNKKFSRRTSFVILVVLFVSQLTFLQFLLPKLVEAAVVTIDATVSITAATNLFSGTRTVFISDQVGYKFYVDSTNTCVYSKTTNGGGAWGAAVIIDAQTDCINVAVWYDQWTPGNGGSYIHIVTMDSGNDDVWYNRLDTTTDTRLLGTAPVSAIVNSGQIPTYVAGVNDMSITEDTNGFIYIGAQDASDSFVVGCSASCNLGTNWNEIGTSPFTLGNDWGILMPLLAGGIIVIDRVIIGTKPIQSKIWNGSSWSGSWTTIDPGAINSATYDVGMAATLDPTTGDIFLAYAADNDTTTVADHDIRTAKYSGGAWSNTTDVITNAVGRYLHQVAISLDTNTDTVYVAYTIQTTTTVTTANVYYATSTAAMSSWQPERGPVNTTAGDLYGIDMNIMSDERIYASWEDPSPDDIFGNTVADLLPPPKVAAVGTPAATVPAGTNTVQLGGAFAIKESQASRNVTSITVSESGTIDGSVNIQNVKLVYDLDTLTPYDCVSESYSGTESQFGTTDTNGFSGADGSSGFTDVVSISPTQAMCVYVIGDVQSTATDGDTIAISITNPSTDVIVSGGITTVPTYPIGFASNTTVQTHTLTQFHYHWRNDTGTETTATSATGGVPDTPLAAVNQLSPRRLRFEVSNEGTLSAPSTQFRLEYGEAAPTCSTISTWTDVGTTSDAWDMYNSANLTEGAHTTNIANGVGGMTDENTTFLTTNGGVRDTTSQTGALTLSATNFVELEYSIIPTASSVQGTTYCFRLTNAGSPLKAYTVYPSATVTADVTLSTRGTPAASAVIPSTGNNFGGTIVLHENSSARTITGITITQTGTIDGQTNINNIKLHYDLDTTAPYDCASESYAGTEPQFGSTDTNGFSAANGSSTFTGSVAISTTQAMCAYVIYDVLSSATNGFTFGVAIANGGNDVTLSTGSISPTTAVTFSTSTDIVGAILNQTHYHWRTDTGSETTAPSATNGIEDTQLTDVLASSTIRLRVGIDNSGYATSTSQQFRLEFGPKITTCSAISVWTPVATSSDDWDMHNSANLTEGANTTNIAVATGGLTDPGGKLFITANAGVHDTSDTSGTLVIGNGQFTELEFSLTSTQITAYDTEYCFRLTTNDTPLGQYSTYAEIRTAPRRDFKIQHGVAIVTGTGMTLTAGVDYTAPASTSSAFVLITGLDNTGSGYTTAGGGVQNARDVTAYISDSSDLTASFTIGRSTGSINNTYVSWEIIEFVGVPGTDNEAIVRGVGTVAMGTAALTASGSPVPTVASSSKVVVFITGQNNGNAGRALYYSSQVTSAWNPSTKVPEFTRGATGSNAIQVSYAVVEYTGINWNVQRVEHTYAAAGVTETEAIMPVNSLSRTFTHVQKRLGAFGNVADFGHEVWLSSIGAVSFKLEAGASTPTAHASVVWVVENTQTSTGRMKVSRYVGSTNGGVEPVTNVVGITPVSAVNNTSVFGVGRAVGANTSFPRPLAGIDLTSSTTFTVWRSEATALLTYRVEILEWPVQGLAIRQDYYRFYVGNDALKPIDPWPVGGVDLGENTSITSTDDPPGDGDNLRLRMTLKTKNSNWPAGLFNFKLQFGQRITSCSAVVVWTDIGAPGSGVTWRGYDAPSVTDGTALSTDPPTGGDLLLSVSDVAASYNELNPSVANPYLVTPDQDIEYDWNIQHNGALPKTVYCFRMVYSDDTPLDGYFNYPQIYTSGFSPTVKNWHWYDDATSSTPSLSLAADNVAPTEVVGGNSIALRVTIGERKHVLGTDVKFKLQYDESPLFSNPHDVVATSSCNATSTWCYTTGGANDNTIISTTTLSDADVCSGGVGNGCGTHNTSANYTTGFSQPVGANSEYAFYIKPAAARVGAVYYFRPYEIANDAPALAVGSSTYPSLVAESASLLLSVGGLPSGTTTAGIMTTATSSASAISFGSVPLDTPWYAAHRITITTNATEGYRVLMFARSQLLNTYGTAIASITGTNAAPVSWAVGCSSGADGCVGYHATDGSLSGGSTRFSPLDSYSGLETNPAEIMYSSLPSDDVYDIVYKVLVRAGQPAGTYQTETVYLAIPSY